MEESKQNQLVGRQDEELLYMTCHICRSPHDHCTGCPYYHQQSCGPCSDEDIDEIKQRLRKRIQGLLNAVDSLKQARQSLFSRRASAERVHELSASVEDASANLQCACKIAFSRAETRLNLIEARSMEKLFDALDSRNLAEIATNLIGSLNSPTQDEDVRKLCKIKTAALNAVELLMVDDNSKPGKELTAFCDLTVTDSWRSVVSQLNSLDLLVVGKSEETANITFHANPPNFGGSIASQHVNNPKPSGR